MTKSKNAGELFLTNSNCAQSVLSSFGPELGLDKTTCMKLAAPFGGGLAKNQHVCGAVSGALMALGLKYGKGINETDDDKKSTFSIANEFIMRFKEKYQSIECLDLLGANMHTEEGQNLIKEHNLFKTKCVHFVVDAASIVEELLQNKSQ